MSTRDVLSVPTVVVGPAVLLTTEFLQTLMSGRPGGLPREPEAALNGDAGRGAGMSRTSISEYSTAVECGRVAASYVGGLSPARWSPLPGEPDDDLWTSRWSGDG